MAEAIKLREIKFSKSDFTLVSDQIIEVKKSKDIKKYVERNLVPVLNSYYSVYIPVDNTDIKPFFII